MTSKKALITGITGQDGSYLAELLLRQGYKVYGTIRNHQGSNTSNNGDVPIYSQQYIWRIRHLLDQITLFPISLENFSNLYQIIEQIVPDECYHLAAQSFVNTSFNDELSTLNSNINSTHYILSAIKEKVPNCKFYFAASSEMFGRAEKSPQNETTPFHPASPYAISKAACFYLTQHYREAYNLYACNGILFNHESERRGVEFLTRKVTHSIAKIKSGDLKALYLGNLEARRDWGYAPEYVKAMWLMLQQSEADNYVVATGRSHSVREFVQLAFSIAGLNWEDWVRIDKSIYRPLEPVNLVGDASKVHLKLGWTPEIAFEDLVPIMVEADLRLAYKID
jgi:GDPmannose 4,6-dehydratase